MKLDDNLRQSFESVVKRERYGARCVGRFLSLCPIVGECSVCQAIVQIVRADRPCGFDSKVQKAAKYMRRKPTHRKRKRMLVAMVRGWYVVAIRKKPGLLERSARST